MQDLPAVAVIAGDCLNHTNIFSKPQHLHALVHIRAHDVVSKGAELQDLRITIHESNASETAIVPFIHENFAEAGHAGVHALRWSVGRRHRMRTRTQKNR